jgi:hypothetical protein
MPEARFLDKESISIETKIRCCNQNVKSFFTSDETKEVVMEERWACPLFIWRACPPQACLARLRHGLLA